MEEIKTKNKRLRKRFLAFSLMALSILSFGLFGFATFGNSDVVTARAETTGIIINSEFLTTQARIAPTSELSVNISNGINLPSRSNSLGLINNSNLKSDLTVTNSSEIFTSYYENFREYYLVTICTQKPELITYLNDNDFQSFIETNKNDIEYFIYANNQKKLNKYYGYSVNSIDMYDFPTRFEIQQDIDNTYYYCDFIIEYQMAKGKKYSSVGDSYVHNDFDISSLIIHSRSEMTELCVRDALIDLVTSSNSNINEIYLDNARSLLGYTASEDSTVTVEFIEMNSFTSYEKKTIHSKVDATYLGNKDYVVSQVFNTLGINDISYFNAKFTDKFVNSDDKQYNLEERIVRQAIGYDYTYDGVENTGKITIKYSDFLYSDLALRVSNNDPSNLLTMNVYTSNATVDNGIATVTWYFNDIQQQLYNTCQWLFELKPEHITVTGVTDNVTVTKTSNALSVSVPIANQNDLFGLTMTAVAEIVEDVDFNMTIKYLRLNEDFSFTEVTTEPITILYSKVINLTDENFMIEYGDLIEDSTSNSSGIDFISYKDVVIKYNSLNKTCTVEVLYNYNTLICAENSNGVKSYMPMNSVSLNYKASDFNFNVPAGYRISNITSEDSRVKINFNEKNPAESTISFNCSTALNEVITITAEITDEWFISVEYLEPYKDSAFSVLTTFNGSIKVSDYADVYALTKEDLAKIIGVNTLDILGLSTVKTVTVTFDGTSTYDVALEYTKASMRKMNSDGSYEEVMVPLTSYAVWCDLYGQEWSILWLNSSDKKIFNYENDVDREKLYGFFSVATFKEQITDLNSILSAYSTNGCRTVYNSHTVQGSEMYKWFNRNKNNVGAIALSNIGIWGCEITNEDNCQVYSYFFYLDGTSDLNYVANNGADDYDDTDSATQNKVEDVTGWLEEKWNNTKDWFTNSTFGKVLKIAIYVIAGLFGLLILIWFIKKIIKAIRG